MNEVRIAQKFATATARQMAKILQQQTKKKT